MKRSFQLAMKSGNFTNYKYFKNVNRIYGFDSDCKLKSTELQEYCLKILKEIGELNEKVDRLLESESKSIDKKGESSVLQATSNDAIQSESSNLDFLDDLMNSVQQNEETPTDNLNLNFSE